MSNHAEPFATSARRRLTALALIGAFALTSACGGDTDRANGGSVSVPTTESDPTADSSPTAGARATSPTDSSVEVAEVTADDIPVAFTPAGGWIEMPPPVLATCTEPLVDRAVDMRGTWEVVSVEVDGEDVPTHEALGELQRIEQCGVRVVITAGGIVHDMRADGSEEGAVHDVAASDKTTPITVIATFEDGVHVLRPVGVPLEVRRRIEGDQLVWDYVGFVARLDQVDAT